MGAGRLCYEHLTPNDRQVVDPSALYHLGRYKLRVRRQWTTIDAARFNHLSNGASGTAASACSSGDDETGFHEGAARPGADRRGVSPQLPPCRRVAGAGRGPEGA